MTTAEKGRKVYEEPVKQLIRYVPGSRTVPRTGAAISTADRRRSRSLEDGGRPRLDGPRSDRRPRPPGSIPDGPTLVESFDLDQSVHRRDHQDLIVRSQDLIMIRINVDA